MDDDGLTAGFFILNNFGPGTHVNFSATGTVCLHDASTTIDKCCSREVRSLDMLHQFINLNIRIVHHGDGGTYHFFEIMRRNIGCHPYRNTGRTVYQQIRHTGRQYIWNLFGAIIVISEINSFLVQIGQQLMCQFLHAHFGIPHGSCRITIN